MHQQLLQDGPPGVAVDMGDQGDDAAVQAHPGPGHQQDDVRRHHPVHDHHPRAVLPDAAGQARHSAHEKADQKAQRSVGWFVSIEVTVVVTCGIVVFI